MKLLQYIIVLTLVLSARQGKAQSYGELRLVQGESFTSSNLTAGRLEIHINNKWGTICDTDFDITDANVACRQLGFTGATRFTTAFHSVPYKQGREGVPIWLDSVNCSDVNLLHILSCPNAGIGVHTCDHFSDVAVECNPIRITDVVAHDDEGLSIRLAGDSFQSSGQVEVYCDGSWTTLCDEQRFGEFEANAVCRQLGYTKASDFASVSREIETDSSVASLTGSIRCPSYAEHISSCAVTCESVLQSCSSSNNNAIFVACNHTVSYGTLRLVNEMAAKDQEEANITGGRLEIFINGRWRTICADMFDQVDADTACREFGYERASRYGISQKLGYNIGNGAIWQSRVDCQDYHKILISCPKTDTKLENSCTHDDDIAVVCTTEPLPTLSEKLFGIFPFSLRIFIIIVSTASLVLLFCCLCFIVTCTHVCCGCSKTSKQAKSTKIQDRWLALYDGPNGEITHHVNLNNYEVIMMTNDSTTQYMEEYGSSIPTITKQNASLESDIDNPTSEDHKDVTEQLPNTVAPTTQNGHYSVQSTNVVHYNTL